MKNLKLFTCLLGIISFVTILKANGQTPLDGLAQQPHAAYSVRLLKKTYSGPAIQVRRSSDNQLVDVYFDASGKLSLKSLVSASGAGTKINLGAWIDKSSAFITTWYDQSGNDNHATQKNSAFQPRIINEGIIESLGNGMASLRMLNGANGGSGFTLPFTLSGVADLNIFTVLKQEGNLTIGNHIFGTSGPTGKTPGKLQMMYFLPNIFAVQSAGILKFPVGPAEVYSVRFKITPDADGTAQISAGGKISTTVTGLLTTPLDSSSPTLYRVGNAAYSRNFEGLSPEFILFNKPVNDLDATKLVASQHSFFGSK